MAQEKSASSLEQKSVFNPGKDKYSIFLEGAESAKPGVLVLRSSDAGAVRDATSKLGKPVAAARVVGGTIKLDVAAAGRCFGSAVALGGRGGPGGGPGPVERGGGR